MQLIRPVLLIAACLALPWQPGAAAPLQPKPSDPFFEKFTPVAAPAPGRLLLKAGDRLAICGDSITEQKMYSMEEHNLHLCALRNVDVEIARRERVRFADIFWPMFVAGFNARQLYGPEYAIAGKDGVHPGWAGQRLMAQSHLQAMGFSGDVGTLTVNLKTQRAKASKGHSFDRAANSEFTFTSRRYPYCATGDDNQDSSIRSGMTLLAFNRHLNRLILKAKGGSAANYRLTWGSESRVYSAAQLAEGVNLADDFAVNPFSEAFKRVDEAVESKMRTAGSREVKPRPARGVA